MFERRSDKLKAWLRRLPECTRRRSPFFLSGGLGREGSGVGRLSCLRFAAPYTYIVSMYEEHSRVRDGGGGTWSDAV